MFYLIYLSLRDLILAIKCQWIDNPLFCVGCKYLLFVCVGAANEIVCVSPTGLITLVLNWGKYLSLLYCIILSSSGKYQRRLQVAITTTVTRIAPATTHTGPITRARARQLNYQVLSFLGNDLNVHENMMLPKLDTFILLTNEGPSMDKKDEH